MRCAWLYDHRGALRNFQSHLGRTACVRWWFDYHPGGHSADAAGRRRHDSDKGTSGDVLRLELRHSDRLRSAAGHTRPPPKTNERYGHHDPVGARSQLDTSAAIRSAPIGGRRSYGRAVGAPHTLGHLDGTAGVHVHPVIRHPWPPLHAPGPCHWYGGALSIIAGSSARSANAYALSPLLKRVDPFVRDCENVRFGRLSGCRFAPRGSGGPRATFKHAAGAPACASTPLFPLLRRWLSRAARRLSDHGLRHDDLRSPHFSAI